MNEKTVLVDASHHLTREMYDYQFSLKSLSSHLPNNSIVDGIEIDVENINTTIISKDERKDEEFIPIVCLDGLVYALENGQLSPLDLCKFKNENVPCEKEEINKKSNHLEIRKYISKTGQCLKSSHESENVNNVKYISIDNKNSEICKLILEKNNDSQTYEKSILNVNDFVEVVAAFKCKICPFTNQDRQQLLEHFENTHTKSSHKNKNNIDKSSDNVALTGLKLLYMCGECSNCFPSMENCREHMINDHELIDKITCDKISNKTPSSSRRPTETNVTYKNESDKVIINETGQSIKISKFVNSEYENNRKNVLVKERNVKCFYRGCLHKFSTEEMMQKHVVCHLNTQNANIFKCHICSDIRFTKWKACCSHLWKKHAIDIDLLCCTICNTYKSVTNVKLLTHMRVHSDNRDYECRDCGKRFKQPSQLRNHRIMHVDRKAVDGSRWYTSKTCEICGKIYADSKCLKNHMQAVHSKLRPYVCNVCGHASSRKAMLQMHLRQHTGDKPFNCDICDFKTGDHNSLRRHIMRHTGVRPYKCPHCSYSAIQSSSYKNHLRAKHPLLSGLFTCEICPFKTVKKESFVEHMGNHAKGLIKTPIQKNNDSNVEVFPGNMAAAQLIYSCLGTFSEVDKTIEASLMSSLTSIDGTLQTITIQIPSTHLDGTLPMTTESTIRNNSVTLEQVEDETMHCFLKIPHEEEESVDTGGITIPAVPEETEGSAILNIDS